MDGSWKVEYDIRKRFSFYNAMGAGYDEIRKIDLRYDIGPGVGYKWIVRTNFVLGTEIGANYQEQFFSDDTTKERYALRLAEESWWQISNKLRIDEKVEFFPKVENFSDHRLRIESNLSYLLRNNLTLKFTVIDLYETRPAKNVSNNDLQIRSSIGIKF
jgi:putative salt-induced outer membrane protein YdiY